METLVIWEMWRVKRVKRVKCGGGGEEERRTVMVEVSGLSSQEAVSI